MHSHSKHKDSPFHYFMNKSFSNVSNCCRLPVSFEKALCQKIHIHMTGMKNTKHLSWLVWRSIFSVLPVSPVVVSQGE